MPARVKRVRWSCSQCGKHRWYVPSVATSKRYCSRECQYASQRRVDSPPKPPKRTYGTRECDMCHRKYEAWTRQQRYCSQACSIRYTQSRRRKLPLVEKSCELCRKAYMPRPGNAGRFCSRACLYEGTKREKSPQWRGGRHITREGYVKVYAPEHPQAHGHGGYVAEHRLVMEQHLGRYLERQESVHHKNGDRADNRIENLQLRSKAHGAGVKARCDDCGGTNIIFDPL